MRKISVYFIVALTFSQMGVSQEVTTNVESSGTVEYFLEEKHHTIFDIGSFIFCLGKKSTVDHGKNSFEESFNGSYGHKKMGTRTKGKANYYTANDLKWNSNFNKEEYKFNISINKKIKSYETLDNNSDKCHTRVHRYKVTKNEVKVSTEFNLTVPENVWVVRLKSKMLHNIYAEFKTRGALEIGDNRINTKEEEMENNIIQGVDGSAYYFVRPNKNLKIDFRFTDKTLKNMNYLGDIEVTFLGFNRCHKDLQKDSFNFKVESLKKNLHTIYSDLKNGKVNGVENFHKTINYIACLTKKETLERLIFDNDYKNVYLILDAISIFRGKVNLLKSKLENTPGKGTYQALKIVSQMLNFRLSYNSIHNIAPLCQKTNLYNGNGQFIKNIYRYEYVSIVLSDLRLIFEEYKEKGNKGHISDIYLKIILPLEKMIQDEQRKNKTVTFDSLYRLMGKKDVYKLTKLVIEVQRSRNIYELLTGKTDNLPVLGHSKYWHNFYLSNADFRGSIAQLNTDIFDFLIELQTKEKREVSLDYIKESFSRMRNFERPYYNSIVALGALFPNASNYDVTEKSRGSMENIGLIFNSFYKGSRNWLLNEEYNGFFKDFVSIVEKDDALGRHDLTMGDIKKCIKVE